MTQPGDWTPAQLVEQIEAGGPGAVEELYRRYQANLIGILHLRHRDYAAVEDIVQNTLILVVRKIRDRELKKPAALTGFVRQIGVNLLKNYRRGESGPIVYPGEDKIPEPVDRKTTPFESLTQAQIDQMVRRAMSRLSTPRDRELLKRRYLYDEDKAVTCEALDLTPAHYDRVLYRARKRLMSMIREMLDDDPSGGPPATLLTLTAVSGSALLFLILATPDRVVPGGLTGGGHFPPEKSTRIAQGSERHCDQGARMWT